MDEFLTSHKVMHATLSPQSAARVYQTFTGLTSQSLLEEGLPALGLSEAAMLDELALLWARFERVPLLFALYRVQQAPHSSLNLSINALGRLLHRLRQGGWLVLESSDTDGRTKHVRPSEQTQRYFSILGQCMAQAIHKEKSRSP